MAREINSTGLKNDANLQGYWRLESNGTDSGPNGYTLTGSGSPTHVVGIFGNGADLESGSTQYYTIADASCPNLEISGSQTWSIWVKHESLASFLCPMAKTTTVNSTDHRILTDSSGHALFQLTGLTTNTQVTSSNTTTTGVWSHIVGKYNSSSTNLSVFLDGVKTTVTASGSANDTNGDFSIGRLGSAASFYFDGVVDDAAIWNRALSDEEIISLFRRGRGAILVH